MMKKRVSRFLQASPCPDCRGRRLSRAALAVTFAGIDIAELSSLSLSGVSGLLASFASGEAAALTTMAATHPEKTLIVRDIVSRIAVLRDLGLGYLSLNRDTPSLSPGELQRLRLGTQLSSQLFGVVYVLDESSAGLHPSDTEALLQALAGLRQSGNSIFVVEHNLDVVRHACQCRVN